MLKRATLQCHTKHKNYTSFQTAYICSDLKKYNPPTTPWNYRISNSWIAGGNNNDLPGICLNGKINITNMWEDSPYVHLGVEGHSSGHGQNYAPRRSLCSHRDHNHHSDCNSHPQVSQAAVVSWAQCLLFCGNHPKPQNKHKSKNIQLKICNK